MAEVAFSISSLPNTTPAVIAVISAPDSNQRGIDSMPIWLTRKESTVLVMPTP
ncbi:Uncharacterised protein [Vibrio cholerae]|nr:Uncharacterised protein [Vibrio cholerae]